MTVCDCEEVAILQTAEVRYCDPRVLVRFVWVARRLSRLRSKSKLCYAIREHLLWVSSIKTVLNTSQSTLRKRVHHARRQGLFLLLLLLCTVVIALLLLLLLFEQPTISIGAI